MADSGAKHVPGTAADYRQGTHGPAVVKLRVRGDVVETVLRRQLSCGTLRHALRLPLDDPDFDASNVSEFRRRLLAGNAERQLFDTLRAEVKTQRFVKAHGRQRTDLTHVLAEVRTRNRLELMGETECHPLNTLAIAAPEWLQAQLAPERTGRRGMD